MVKKINKQCGMGFIGILICLAIFGFFVYMVLALWPLYYAKMTVTATMNRIVSQPNAATISLTQVRKDFLKNIHATSNIEHFNEKNVKQAVNIAKPSRKNGTPRMLVVKYEESNKFIKDLHFTIKFEESLPMTKNSARD